MKTIFLAILFALPNGQIISGNEMDGWADMQMPSMEACNSRAKSMYANNYHESQKPKGVKAMVVFCKVAIK